jgi:hypothetical protein
MATSNSVPPTRKLIELEGSTLTMERKSFMTWIVVEYNGTPETFLTMLKFATDFMDRHTNDTVLVLDSTSDVKDSVRENVKESFWLKGRHVAYGQSHKPSNITVYCEWY